MIPIFLGIKLSFRPEKKYCFALDLKNDPEKIQAYIDHHKRVWPEIKESIKNAGINQLEIFHTHNRLFMIVEGNKDFSLQKKSKMDSENPFVQKWEEIMWEYQKSLPNTKKGTKWVLMEKIYDLDKSFIK